MLRHLSQSHGKALVSLPLLACRLQTAVLLLSSVTPGAKLSRAGRSTTASDLRTQASAPACPRKHTDSVQRSNLQTSSAAEQIASNFAVESTLQAKPGVDTAHRPHASCARMRRGGWRFGLLFTLCLHLKITLAQHASGGFIRADGGRFVDEDCNEFIPSGLNT